MIEWIRLFSKILLFLMAGAVLGWNFGYPLVGCGIALLAIVLFWCYQMIHLQQWLKSPEQPPADLYGSWAEIGAAIYKHQREAAQSKQQLQSNVDYLLESFTSMRDGVVIVEANGGIRWCNETATRLLNLRYPEDAGQAITNLVRYPDLSAYIAAGEYSEPLYLSTDTLIKLHLQIIITRFGAGDSLIFVRDVTDRVKLEQMRRDFVGNVSHELRTPLTVISGYLGTMLAETDQTPAAYIKPMRQMAQQADRMESLLKDLLWLSRIESEEHQEKHESFVFSGLLQELRDELSSAHPDRKIVYEISSDSRINGDYRQLYSAAANLAHNAIRYSGDESVITVSWIQEGDTCVLSVRDQGVGISASHIPRLTERFYRVDDSRNSASGGTGLGLAIVKHVAVSHGLTLDVESKLGQGSVFKLIFPIPADGFRVDEREGKDDVEAG